MYIVSCFWQDNLQMASSAGYPFADVRDIEDDIESCSKYFFIHVSEGPNVPRHNVDGYRFSHNATPYRLPGRVNNILSDLCDTYIGEDRCLNESRKSDKRYGYVIICFYD